MRRELQAYLDGELSFDQLPAELRDEARRWERLLADVRETRPQGAPAGLQARVLRALPERRRRPTVVRLADWAVRPRSVRISPLAGLAAAAVIAFLLFLPRGDTPLVEPEDGATIYVQFLLEAPTAKSVAVAGDFNQWAPEMVLTDADGDGIWTGRVALKPGVHQYMFVIDGSEWLTDPNADRYADDGFGNRNAVLVIAQPTSQS